MLQIVSVDEMQVHPDPSDYSDFGVELEIRKASADGTQVSRGGLFWFWCLHSTLRFEKRLHCSMQARRYLFRFWQSAVCKIASVDEKCRVIPTLKMDWWYGWYIQKMCIFYKNLYLSSKSYIAITIKLEIKLYDTSRTRRDACTYSRLHWTLLRQWKQVF